MKTLPFLCMALLSLPPVAFAAEGDKGIADLQGEGISGTVTMTETASGAILVVLEAGGLPEGTHGFHVHETGSCDSADGFKSAGGHLSGGLSHGVNTPDGPHPGDLPNVHVQADGAIKAEFFTYGFSMGDEGDVRIFDEDGSAVVIHSNADDYSSQPSGDAGDRIACGVLRPAG